MFYVTDKLCIHDPEEMKIDLNETLQCNMTYTITMQF